MTFFKKMWGFLLGIGSLFLIIIIYFINFLSPKKIKEQIDKNKNEEKKIKTRIKENENDINNIATTHNNIMSGKRAAEIIKNRK